jgi:diguanylate cyclase (GGDEF)-like protein/PAS domain S-box-containing protein
LNRSAEEQVLGVGPLDAARHEASATGVLVFLTICLLLSVLALAVARGESLRAADALLAAHEVKLAVVETRVAVDEGRTDRTKELLQRLHDLTAENRSQQARADELAGRLGDLREVRIRLDVMSGEQDAIVSLRESEARKKRIYVQIAMLFCTAFAIAFSGAAIFIVRKGRRDLGKQTAMLGSIVDSIGDAVVAVDRDGKCVIVNAAFRRMFGVGFGQGQIGIDEALQHSMRREDGSPLDFDEGPIGRALRGEAIDNFDVSLHSDGQRVWLSATSRPVRNERREIESGVVVLRDVTQERNDRELLVLQAAELQVQSLSDELTGLYNRRGFMVLSEQYARTAARQKRPYAILFCDLNGLKAINDTHGHEAGDDAIARMAGALQATFREADIVARLGGDEYVALVDGADETSIAQVIARLRQEMDADAERHETPSRLHTSIGVAFQPPDGTQTIEQLLTLADERMYEEKKTSKESRDARAREEAAAREAAAREATIREAKLKEARARAGAIRTPNRPFVPPRPTPRAKS